MEKLIELLNEYQYWMFVYEDDLLLLRIWSNVKVWGETFVISKKFWFIKWLVENDKIDFSKLEKIWYEKTVYGNYWQYREIVEYSDLECLLMLLSISDTPIEDLILYLK